MNNELAPFNQLNLNPKGNKSGDCVIRAIAYAIHRSWEDTYRDLVEYSISISRVFNEKQCYSKYLKKRGWIKEKALRDINGKSITVNEFALRMKHGTYIIHTRKHLTVVDQGTIIDTWNTRYEKAGIYYKIEREED